MTAVAEAVQAGRCDGVCKCAVRACAAVQKLSTCWTLCVHNGRCCRTDLISCSGQVSLRIWPCTSRHALTSVHSHSFAAGDGSDGLHDVVHLLLELEGPVAEGEEKPEAWRGQVLDVCNVKVDLRGGMKGKQYAFWVLHTSACFLGLWVMGCATTAAGHSYFCQTMRIQ